MNPGASYLSDMDGIELRALGKLWGRLIAGRYLEVRRGDRIAYIDIWLSTQAKRAVIVSRLSTVYCQQYDDMI